MNLSENGRRLETAIATTLGESGIPTEEEIASLAAQLRVIALYNVDNDEFDYVIRRLHQSLRIDMGLGTRIVQEYRPWLLARKPDIDPFYWKRYRLSLRAQGWAPRVISALDQVTDDVLDLCGNPASTDGWPRRGLVMGDVQSGKTSNYTGLICKAADAGYRLVVLLTGTLESLRRQTQGRLDSGFVGLDSSGLLTRSRQRREIGVGALDRRRAAGVFTSTLVDFRVNMVNQLGFRLDAFHEPVLLVVKKNPKILSNLADWLRNFNAGPDGLIDLPMLLIDDEADNASINTNPTRATTINAGIRTLLKIFPRSTYVGFTATPFANVFIHPESTEEMLGDDLFPRDFVYALDPPSNYIGAARIFGDSADSHCLRLIEDAETVFPVGHRASLVVEHLPESLQEAIRTFVLANAIMDVRGGGPKHRSMLVNVSHFTEVQNQVKELIGEYLRGLQQDIQNYAMLPAAGVIRFRTFTDLQATYRKQFSGDIAWQQVQHALQRAALPIDVRAVNQRTGAASLSYVEHEQHGLRVIAVGGNSLSRGITLEGLCISYFFRNTQMYDSLLQMGRWFGYRPGYEDLMRIWLSPQAKNWYTHIAEASEELRDQIRQMQVSRLRPIDFGIKVRSHPDSLLITARNKMRHSSEITRILSVSGEGLETARLLSDNDVLAANYRSSVQFLRRLINIGQPVAEGSGLLWKNVPKELVTEFLRGFVAHPLNVTFHGEDLARFVEASQDEKLRHWDVVVPSGQGSEQVVVDQLAVSLQRRKLLVERERRSILVSEQKMRVGSRGLDKAGMDAAEIQEAERRFFASPENAGKTNVPDRAYRLVRRRALLAVHFLEGTVEGNLFHVPPGVILSAIGLSFPELASGSARAVYRINLVEIKNLLAETDEGDTASDDEDEEDEA